MIILRSLENQLIQVGIIKELLKLIDGLILSLTIALWILQMPPV